MVLLLPSLSSLPDLLPARALLAPLPHLPPPPPPLPFTASLPSPLLLLALPRRLFLSRRLRDL
ncbi:hypothetical protein ACMD2_13569 [Ananas comosus]|uniref:Uncharacterized protein n=1 Tax=Ananas comosus TaxID=4615 RepID=A0A199UQU5_ANACO|nr:hypothetical protein ACMD2_13569 [Ananas comosus]